MQIQKISSQARCNSSTCGKRYPQQPIRPGQRKISESEFDKILQRTKEVIDRKGGLNRLVNKNYTYKYTLEYK